MNPMKPVVSRVSLKGFVMMVATTLAIFQPSLERPAQAMDREAQILLGTLLFFDPRLSRDNQMSCATCHKPELAFTDGLPLAKGYNGKTLKRNTPALLHLTDHSSFFWDGRSSSLEQQDLEPIQNPDEMNQNLDALVAKLNQIPGYVSQFQKLYGTPVTVKGITQALAAFERTLISKDAPFDRFLAGQKTAISPAAQRGINLFQDKARCAFCHKGFNFTDSDFHNIGVPSLPGQKEDVGRYAVTRRAEDREAFRTPTLRNATQTAPYMHNGIFKTLGEVVEFYNKGGGKNPNLDIQMKPLGLTAQEKKDLVEFLKTLTGSLPKIVVPSLP